MVAVRTSGSCGARDPCPLVAFVTQSLSCYLTQSSSINCRLSKRKLSWAFDADTSTDSRRRETLWRRGSIALDRSTCRRGRLRVSMLELMGSPKLGLRCHSGVSPKVAPRATFERSVRSLIAALVLRLSVARWRPHSFTSSMTSPEEGPIWWWKSWGVPSLISEIFWLQRGCPFQGPLISPSITVGRIRIGSSLPIMLYW